MERAECGGHGLDMVEFGRQFAGEMDYVLAARLRLIEIYIRIKVGLIY